jgi:hypothetical protein
VSGIRHNRLGLVHAAQSLPGVLRIQRGCKMAVQISDAANPVTSEAFLHNIGRYASAAIDIGSLAFFTTKYGPGCCGRGRINH